MKTEDNNTPENRPADDAVVDAFSKALDSDEQFRNRWKKTVEQAQKRREERKTAQEARMKTEAEKRARLEREQNPRVTEESKPGTPMDIEKLSAIALTKNIIARTPEPEPCEPEPEDFSISTDITAEEDGFAADGTIYSPPVSSKDREIKKKFRERLRFRFRTRLSRDGFKRFTARNFPTKGDDKAEITRKFIRCASFVALICALGFLGGYFVDYCQRISTTNSFEDEMNKLGSIEGDELEDAWAQIRAQYPDIQFPEGMNIKFTELYAINQHVVGWLKIDNTNINTVLLQADNNSYHLRMNIYDEYSRFGNPYVHYACKMGKEGLSKNTILFGHNANDGLMFHDLINYMTVDGYLKSPVVTLDTLYEQTKWKVFGVVLTNAHSSEDNGYVWQYLYPEFNSTAHFNQILSEIDERTIIHTGVDVNENDRIITLYTCCTYQLDSGRLAIFARQLREGESEDIDASRVYYNQDARYPQKWYDRNKKVNPYADPTEAASDTTPAHDNDAPDRDEENADTAEQLPERDGEQPTADAEEPAGEPLSEAPPENETPEQPPEEDPASEAPAQSPDGDSAST